MLKKKKYNNNSTKILSHSQRLLDNILRFLLAPAHLDGLGKMAGKWLYVEKVSTDQTPFLLPNQQCQSNEWNSKQ